MKTNLVKTALTISIVLVLSALSGAADIALTYVTSAYVDNDSVGMNNPEGIACSDDAFIVADTGNDRFLRYAYSNDTMVSQASFRVQELLYPIRLQIGPAGDIYALDGKLLKIARIGQDGTFKGFMKFTGTPGSDEVIPRSFKIDGKSGLVYILDIYGGRVLVVDATGSYQRQIPFPKPHGFFSDLAVNPKGDVLLLDSIKGVLYRAPADGSEFSILVPNLKDVARFPSNITTDDQGTIFIVDHHGGSILVVGIDGSILGHLLDFGWNESLLNYPSQICIGREHSLLVADTNNSRVQMFKVIR